MLYLARILGIAAVYYGAAKLGLELAFTTPSVTAIWAPTGIALAAVVLWGYGVWPGVALGALLANAWTDVPAYTVLGITAGNTLEALAGAYLLRRVDFRPALERVRDVVALAVLAGAVATTVSATIGVGSLFVGDEIGSGDLGTVWRTWWLGDMGGALVVAPALLVAFTHWPYRRAPGRAFEAVGLALLLAGVTAIVFTREIALTFLLWPLVIVAAVRFWQPGTVAATLLVAAIAIPLTENDLGPFAGNTPDERLLLAQAFISLASITALVLAAVITERQRVEDTLAQIAETLQESLLPSPLPEIPGVETAVYYRAAGERQIVGGDFYDVFPADDGSWAVVIGDVVGKGATAAATTALARYTLRAAAIRERQPSRILEELHEAILRQAPDQCCTVVYSRLEPRSGAVRMTLSSAGHPLPLVLRADGEAGPIGERAHVLGLAEQPPLSDSAVDLGPGDALLVYTDGLTDAYAPARLVYPVDIANALRECAGGTASEIVQGVQRTILADDEGEPRDDVLLFVLRVPAAAGNGAARRG
jgi:integral membrane sensor domain MASE1